jgi:hypothetical protein
VSGENAGMQTAMYSMTLSEYFEKARSFGVLATTDAAGQINQAIYDKPYFLVKFRPAGSGR